MTSLMERALHGYFQQIASRMIKAMDVVFQSERKQHLIGPVAFQAKAARKVVTKKIELHLQKPPADTVGPLMKSANARSGSAP